MKQSIRLWSMSVSVFSCLILSSCAGVPPHNLSLDQAKSEYAYASQNAYVKQAAPEQLQKAADAIDRSEALLSKGAPESDVEHYAYLAKQRVAIANQKAKTDAIQQKIKLAGSRRDKMMLESGQQKIDLLSGEVAKQKADAAASQEKERLAKSEQDKSVLEGKQQKIDMLSKQISDLKIQRTSRGLVLTLGSVLFDLNKASLKGGARKNIAKIAKFMNDNSSVTELLAPNYLASNAINISNTPSGLNLNGPDGLAVDSSGRVWIPNDNGNSVTELSRSSGGTITGGNFASGSFSAPDASAVDQSGNIWTTNTSGNSVTEMIVTGGTVTFVNFSGGSTGFNSPTEIAVDGAGNIWVANYTPNSVGASVTELTKSSGYAVSSAVNLLESPAPGGPQGIAVDKSGNVWIANDLSNSVTELPGVATGLTTLPKLAGAP